MAEHPAEVAEITRNSHALALNLGNITDARMKSMPESLKIAASLHIPVMLDLVRIFIIRLPKRIVHRISLIMMYILITI